MKFPRLQRRTLTLLAVTVPLVVLFGYVALRSGPLAPVAVTVTPVESRSIAPARAAPTPASTAGVVVEEGGGAVSAPACMARSWARSGWRGAFSPCVP